MTPTEQGPANDTEPTRVPTFGEKAVGLSFNPSGDATVNEVKQLYAQIIDLCNGMAEANLNPGMVRLLRIAITEAQGAQMWAVKALTWKDQFLAPGFKGIVEYTNKAIKNFFIKVLTSIPIKASSKKAFSELESLVSRRSLLLIVNKEFALRN